MKCTRCGLKEATVHSCVSVNNKMQQMDLCADCANELKAHMGLGADLFGQIFGQSSMGLLPGIFKLFDAPTTKKLVCPVCKTSGDEFVKTGYVGCPHCYEAFEPLIIQAVKKMQQSDRHIGKSPIGAVKLEEEEARLKAELQAAVESGDYSRLSVISEKLNKLVGNKHNGEV